MHASMHMIRQPVLVEIPHARQSPGTLRPALNISGEYLYYIRDCNVRVLYPSIVPGRTGLASLAGSCMAPINPHQHTHAPL